MFSKIPQRTDGYVYVDKIALIYNLMSKGINNSPMEPRKTIDSFVAKCKENMARMVLFVLT